MDALVAACEAKVRDELRPALAARMSAALGDSGWAVESDPFDPQSLIFRYPSAFAEAGEAPYIQRSVKIEEGARADAWPTEDRWLHPYVAEAFPAGVRDAEVSVRVLSTDLRTTGVWRSLERRIQIPRRCSLFPSFPSVLPTEGNEENEKEGNWVCAS